MIRFYVIKITRNKSILADVIKITRNKSILADVIKITRNKSILAYVIKITRNKSILANVIKTMVTHRYFLSNNPVFIFTLVSSAGSRVTVSSP